MLGISIAFAGQIDSFIRNDLPLVLIAVIAAFTGSFVVSLTRQKQSSGVSSGSI